jgi:hypothetical protein
MATPIEYATLTTSTAKVTLGCKSRRRSFRKGNNPWVRIHGHIVAPEGEWSFADESLMIDEIATLAAWLRDVVNGTASNSGPTFVENNLRFSASRSDGAPPQSTGERILLRIRFCGEISPPWLWGDAHKVWDEGYWLELAVTPRKLEIFASDLLRLIGR